MKKTSENFLDLSKAFDTVNHGFLLKKLETHGARGIALLMVARFLQNRKQFLQIGLKNSKFQDTNAKVPQGSVLGPLLFLIYINDITDIQHGNSQIDVLVDYFSILISHQHNLFPSHEKHLHQISKWFSANKLTPNLEKIFYLKFGRTKSMKNTL